VIYRLLGELEIGRDGDLIDLPGGPTLIVLAVLLANANRRMSKTDLIRAAWGIDDVQEAQLHKRVTAVRALLAQIGRGGDLKTHSRFGYEMRVARDDVDALLFQQLVGNAEKARAERRTEDEIECLWQALRLWRGPHPLSNVPSEALRQEILALEQRRKRAAARLFDMELACGNHERVLDELISLGAGIVLSSCMSGVISENAIQPSGGTPGSSPGPTATSPGTTRGRMTRRNTCMRVAPSIEAASSRSGGMPSM